MNKRVLVAASVLGLAAVFAIGAYVANQIKKEQMGFIADRSFATFVRPHSQTVGAADAKVYLTEFSDPACETCAQFAPFLKDLLAAHPGKIKLVYRYAPLHPGSDVIVKMLEASVRQGKFHDALATMFKTQPLWASHSAPKIDALTGFLADAGIDIERLKRDMNDPAVEAAVAQDVADGRSLSVTQTPEFFVNGRPLVPFGFKELKELVESELAAKYPN